MSMTKTDYELIAENLRIAVDMFSYHNIRTEAVTATIYQLAKGLESDNNKFNRNKFLLACGIEQDN